MNPISELYSQLDRTIKKDFEKNKRILSFDEFISLVQENPKFQLRGSAAYVADMLDHFGKSEPTADQKHSRFKLFDLEFEGAGPVMGQEGVQAQLYRSLKTFERQGRNNKLILLHGPNGSAKSSMAHSLMAGLEKYSHQTPEGALYTFNWIFPVDRITKGGMGINSTAYSHTPLPGGYAKLPDEDIAAKINCDLKDHPLLLIPAEQRRTFLSQMLGEEKVQSVWEKMPEYLKRGDLCQRCKQISEALLTAHQGDYKRVLSHIQVERFYFSRRYRRGLVTIEPQMHVDAHSQMIAYNKNISTLPASLHNINFYALGGDVIEGNRGMIEMSDLLKRPVDTFKYLLGACETGSVPVGSSIAYLDTLWIGSTNEIQLDAFKEFPDFSSFKARIELIRVPYLLKVSQEQKIYETELKQMAGEKHCAPHTAWTAAYWAVLTRLKKPSSMNYGPALSSLISQMTPIEKARLYDHQEIPAHYQVEEKKNLKANIQKIKQEYDNVPYYEGRMGASAREMKSVLYDAAQNAEFDCLSPLALLRELEEFVKRVSENEFLKQEIKDQFHNAPEFIHTVREEYLTQVDREVRDSVGIYNSTQWEDFLKKYVQQVSLILKKEKQKNSITGKMEDPDFSLVEELEKIVGAPSGASELESFRQNVISQVGAWSLDHRGEPMVYARVFSEFWAKLEKHFFESQKQLLTKMHDALLTFDKDLDQTKRLPQSEGGRLAEKTIQTMKSRYHYCDACAIETILFLMKSRY